MTGTLEAVIPPSFRGTRLDQALARLFPDFSRSRLKDWIVAGRVLVDGRAPRPRELVAGGERVRLAPLVAAALESLAEPIALEICHEDEALLVVVKPAGLVVHPGAGNPRGTLVNALLHHAPELRLLPRAGLVHRLDKDTSGLLLVARTIAAHAALVRSLAQREIEREYTAIAVGLMSGGGTVDAPLGRHPADRLRQAVRSDGRAAVTHYRVRERFRAHTLVQVHLETGRTHQIRVHLAHIGYPLLGDPTYGRRLAQPRGAGEELRAALASFRRQALHAGRLALAHPASGVPLSFEAPLPADFAALLTCLRRDARRTTAAG
jgi:23S rRNA pseudouridine1911/1915/1917 synthase